MSRPETATDAVANKYVDDLSAVCPSLSEVTARPLPENTWEDFSPAGVEVQIDLARQTLRRLGQVETVDEVDEVTQAALRHNLRTAVECFEAGMIVGKMGNIGSPLQVFRDGFQLLPQDTLSQCEDLVRRLEQLPQAFANYRLGVEYGCAHGNVPTRVAVDAILKDLRQQAEQSDPYARVVSQLRSASEGQAQLAQQLRASDLLTRAQAAATRAGQARAEFADFLRSQVEPVANNEDAVGRERLALHHRSFLGADVEVAQTYEWALERLRAIHREQTQIARDIYGDVTVAQALQRLDEEPAYTLRGTDALLQWMQATADEAVADLAGKHFTVPDEIRTIECCISPAGDGGIFYTAPADDFSRPGRMWWSVPPGQETFHTWQEKTTVYHEGMPGHHMQLGVAVTQKAQMNTWRRLLCWYSGHGEGWALYAEALMDELGYLADPADRMGMLDAQRLRAARVVVDLGLHASLPLPSPAYLSEIGIEQAAWEDALGHSPYAHLGPSAAATGVWDRNAVWAFMKNNVAMDPSFLAFETTRYLTWPGQACSYAVGQRHWEATREKYLRLHPQASLREFHDRALALGGLPLSVLDSALGVDY